MYGNRPTRFTRSCSTGLVSADCLAFAAAVAITSSSVFRAVWMRTSAAATDVLASPVVATATPAPAPASVPTPTPPPPHDAHKHTHRVTQRHMRTHTALHHMLSTLHHLSIRILSHSYTPHPTPHHTPHTTHAAHLMHIHTRTYTHIHTHTHLCWMLPCLQSTLVSQSRLPCLLRRAELPSRRPVQVRS